MCQGLFLVNNSNEFFTPFHKMISTVINDIYASTFCEGNPFILSNTFLLRWQAPHFTGNEVLPYVASKLCLESPTVKSYLTFIFYIPLVKDLLKCRFSRLPNTYIFSFVMTLDTLSNYLEDNFALQNYNVNFMGILEEVFHKIV